MSIQIKNTSAKDNINTVRSNGTSCSNVDSGVASQDEDEDQGNSTGRKISIENNSNTQSLVDNERKSIMVSNDDKKR